MILEVTSIHIQAQSQDLFESAVAKGVADIIQHSKGYLNYALHQQMGEPQHYALHIQWQHLDNHLVDFRQSENFTAWRALISPYFAAPPTTQHYTIVQP